MNDKIKNYLGISLIILALVGALAAGAYVYFYSKTQPASFRNFSVAGEGKVTTVPDIAQFNVSVITEGGKNLAELQKTNTEKANKIIEF